MFHWVVVSMLIMNFRIVRCFQ